jgi:tetratricopeptide (TPR) repeat protein
MEHAMADFAAEVRRHMTERGMTLRGLARAASYDPSYLSKVLSGRKPAPAALRARLDEILDAGGAIEHAADACGGTSPDDRDRLSWAARHPGRTDAQAAEALADVLASQRLLEDRIGSAPMLAAVTAQASAAEAMALDAPVALHSRLLGLAAEYGSFRGWLYENTRQFAKAIGAYDRSLAQAAEADSPSLVSEMLSMKGHVAWALGDPVGTVRLSQAAQRDAAAHPAQHAISAMQEARALAVLGDARTTARKLSDADRAEREACRKDGDRPPWLYYQSPAFFSIQRGRIWLHLGAHNPAHNRDALRALTAGIGQLDETARHSEWGASYSLHLARAHMQSGDAEQAYAIALDVAVIAQQLSSASLLASVRRLHGDLARRWPGFPDAEGLGAAIRGQ